jgi:hypothetical protein
MLNGCLGVDLPICQLTNLKICRSMPAIQLIESTASQYLQHICCFYCSTRHNTQLITDHQHSCRIRVRQNLTSNSITQHHKISCLFSQMYIHMYICIYICTCTRTYTYTKISMYSTLQQSFPSGVRPTFHKT